MKRIVRTRMNDNNKKDEKREKRKLDRQRWKERYLEDYESRQ